MTTGSSEMLTGDELVDALAGLYDRHPAGDDAPYLGYVDGALTGLLLVPDIPPDEWLPIVGAGPDTGFADPADRERLVRLLQNRKAEIALGLLEGGLAFVPLYDFDDDGEPLWQLWLFGLVSVLRLRQADWQALIASDDEDMGTAVIGLMGLLVTLPAFAGALPEDPTPDEFAELAEQAPHMLPYFVETIYRRQRGLERVVMDDGLDDAGLDAEYRPAIPLWSAKVGRNDPCPCGSGKKYKKCCGAAA